MEEKNSGKKKARTTNLPAEAAVLEAAEAAVPAEAEVAEAAVTAAARLLTDDLIVEILSRLPARSVHRFKCVSPSWRDLIADPAHRKKLPHTIAGFLYSTYNREDPCLDHFHFASVSAGAAPPLDPSLPFLSPDVYLLDTCNGLLLCLAGAPSSTSSTGKDMFESHYIVCNPATKRRVDLPPHPKGAPRIARLAFDPAFSSHFHVLQFEKTNQGGYITGVNIYSSRTGVWNHRESRSVEKFCPYFSATSVFFRGMLHLLSWVHPNIEADAVLVAVDMEGQVRETIRVPSGGMSFGRIGLSQGCLHYATTSSLVFADKNNKEEDTSQDTNIAAVWYMKDYDSKEWVLKHTFSNDELRSITAVDYKVAAIHPDCDTIFLDSWDADTLASYDMQRRKFHLILHLEKNKAYLFLPYVPLFSDSLAGADGQ